jgi:hypothetical protein
VSDPFFSEAHMTQGTKYVGLPADVVVMLELVSRMVF